MINMNDLRVAQEIAQERYKPLIRQREIERVFGPQPSLYRILLAALGRQLVRWGSSLQARSESQPCCV